LDETLIHCLRDEDPEDEF